MPRPDELYAKLKATEDQRDDLQVQAEEIRTLIDCAIDHLLEVCADTETGRKHLNTATTLACIAQKMLEPKP